MNGKVDDNTYTDIRKEWARTALETYTKAIEVNLRQIFQSKLGLTVPPGSDKEALKAFVDGNGLSIQAAPLPLPTLFVLVQHGKEIGRFNLLQQ